MKCITNRRDYNYNTAYDADGNLVSYDQGSINDWWLNNSGTVVSVDFARSPNLTIGDFSFSNCGLQGDLEIPDNFISIGRNAFQSSDGIQDIYVNIPEGNMFNGSNEQSPFYDGPVGKLYVTSQYVLEYGGVGAFYPPTNGMEVALWADHKDSVIGEEVSPDYTITNPLNSVEEGISSVVTVNTTSVLSGTTLYWTLSKPSEFSVSSGSFTINNNVGTFNITPLLDQDIDPAEVFDIQIRTGSTSGPIVESKTITINDKTPTYTITTNSSVDEGSSLSVTVDTTNVADQTLYWSSTETNDIDVSSGSFSLTSDQGTFSIPITADGVSDPGETFTFVIRTGSVGGTVVATSDPITINDIANPPTYAVVPASSSVDEGVALNVTVNTTNVADSTTLYWTVTNASEFSTSSGSFVITSNTGSFSVTPTLDANVDSDTFDIQIRTGSIAGTIVETTDTPITIVDKTPTYSLVHDNNVDEGSALNVTLNTTNVADQTLYWVVTSDAGDFSTSNGSFSLTSNTGSFSITPDADSTTEGTEQFFFVVKTGSINGTTVASSSGVTINDTSQDPGFTPITLYRINCGSSLVSATDGDIDWAADNGSFVTNSNGTYSNIDWVADSATAPPPSYVPKAVFKTDRYGPMEWTFSSLDNGDYTVNLGFSETYPPANSAGIRVFDVYVNNVLVLDNYDRYLVGGGQGYASWQSIPVTVSAGSIEIDFVQDAEQPTINVIEIIQTG